MTFEERWKQFLSHSQKPEIYSLEHKALAELGYAWGVIDATQEKPTQGAARLSTTAFDGGAGTAPAQKSSIFEATSRSLAAYKDREAAQRGYERAFGGFSGTSSQDPSGPPPGSDMP